MIYPPDYIRNEKLCSMMESAIDSREPFCWLFTGVPGCGKTMAAEMMISAVIKSIYPPDMWTAIDSSQACFSLLRETNGFDSIKKRATIVSTTAHRLYSEYMRCVSSSELSKNSDIRQLNSALCKSIVFIDDLGCEQQTESSRSFFANLFSEQYDWLRAGNANHVIITTNLSSSGIIDMYGERVMDRIFEYYTIVKFTNPSYRAKKLKKIEV
jgi:DNA replication protein DnaC